MNEPIYRHVLFKDLQSYLNKEDYLKGFTTIEQAWIRKNIGAASQEDVDKVLGKVLSYTYKDFNWKRLRSELVPGTLYLITDFQTIYLSDELNKDNKHITYGNLINPSTLYTLLVIATDKNCIMKTVVLISDNIQTTKWVVEYDPEEEYFEDGECSKGKITYLRDTNFNQADYDFKEILFNGKHVLTDSNGNENSDNCFNNNLCFTNRINLTGNCKNNNIIGSNIQFNYSVSNLYGTLNDVILDSNEIDFNDDTLKTTIKVNDTYYIDYLDSETLTHLFYALSNNLHITS